MIIPPTPFKKKKDEDECPACAALRTGTTWIGEPPKCPKHRRIDRPEVWG